MERVKNILTNLCRVVVGLTFLFSGYVKAIDPLGTQYKIEEYLEALGLQAVFPDWCLLIASVLLSGLEFSLGIFILFAIRRRLCSKLVAILTGAMTVVTLWLVIADPVQDCGCFGDAITLTNQETFVKNLILMACTIVLWKWPLRMARLISKSNQWIAINYTILFILVSSVLSLWYLPVFDFRPYSVGVNIKKGMEIPKDAPRPKFETTFIMEKNGHRKTFTLDHYPDSTWKFIDSKTVQTAKGYVPPIHDFSITDRKSGEDITDKVLSKKGYTFLLIAPYLETADDNNFGKIDQIYEFAQSHNYPFYGLTSSGEGAIRHWEDYTGAEYPFFITDATTLKTMIRSNPGLILLKQGTIIRKWSHNNLPTGSQLDLPLEKSELGKMEVPSITGKVLKIVLWFILPLLLLTLADRLWAWSRWIKEKEKEDSNKIHQLFKRKENEKENCSR